MISWDDEFSKEVSKLQRELVDYMILQGADLVVGSGTKVPQLIEKEQSHLRMALIDRGWLLTLWETCFTLKTENLPIFQPF